MSKSKAIVLLVGESGSGKTTIADYCCSTYGYKSLQSYTTRPKRSEDETGHTFITEKEFGELKDLVAFTEYNGYLYCATSQQVEENDIYVIDVEGIRKFLSSYKGKKKPYIIYLKTSKSVRKERMRERGDSEEAITQRIKFDESAFANVEDYADFICANDYLGDIDCIADFIDSLLIYSERSAE